MNCFDLNVEASHLVNSWINGKRTSVICHIEEKSPLYAALLVGKMVQIIDDGPTPTESIRFLNHLEGLVADWYTLTPRY